MSKLGNFGVRTEIVGRDEILGDSFVGLEEILGDSFVGREEILGLEEILGSNVVTSAASKAVSATKKIAGLPLDAVAWALKRAPTPSKSWFIGLEEILGHETRAQRRARRQQHVQNLKTRAAAGDQQAIAKLQKMQADLALPGVSPQSTTPYYPPAAPPALPQTTYPAQNYPTGTYSYPAQSAYAYQSPYYDPSLSQNPYGPPPQPTIDVYQGDDESGLCVRTDSLGRQEIVDGWSPWGAIKSVATAPLKAVKYSFTVPYKAARAYSNPNKQVKSWSDLTRFSGSDALEEILGSNFVGDDEREVAREGSHSDREAMARRVESCGFNGHQAFIRGDAGQDNRPNDKIIVAKLTDLKKRAESGDKKAVSDWNLFRTQFSHNRAMAESVGTPQEKNEHRRLAMLLEKNDLLQGDDLGAFVGDAGQDGQSAARKILSAAAAARQISRADLKKAIWLYAGKQSTEKERTAVGSKMISYLNERRVSLT